MKRLARPWLFLCVYLIFFAHALFASGKKDAEERAPVNAEFVFCVTAPDVSDMPLQTQITGDTIARSLAGMLSRLDFRLRGEEEAAYYRDHALAKSRAEAAVSLDAKRRERDLLLYRGDPSWKYRKSLEVVNNAIARLEEDLANLDASAFRVEEKPAFMLSEKNRDGAFPPPPPPGEEYRFCSDAKLDAFLALSLSEYYGRIYLEIKMYTLYTRSYSFEDSVLFSSDDIDEAANEIGSRLAAAASQTLPAGVLVRASPPGAMTLIDGVVAGEELHTHLPGEAEISVWADNHIPALFQVDLMAGELAELFIDLTPLGMAAFETLVPASPGSRVYLGSLYVGEAPLTLRLPLNQFSYISVETPGGETGSLVYRDNALVRGDALFVRAGDGGQAAFNTAPPVSPDDKKVDKARRGFYGAYGAFWIILPVSLFVAGFAGNYISAHNYLVASGVTGDGYQNSYDSAMTASYISFGANAAWIASLGVTLFQVFRYLRVSGRDAEPIVKAPSVPEDEE
jgi:hypothetical protein